MQVCHYKCTFCYYKIQINRIYTLSNFQIELTPHDLAIVNHNTHIHGLYYFFSDKARNVPEELQKYTESKYYLHATKLLVSTGTVCLLFCMFIICLILQQNKSVMHAVVIGQAVRIMDCQWTSSSAAESPSYTRKMKPFTWLNPQFGRKLKCSKMLLI